MRVDYSVPPHEDPEIFRPSATPPLVTRYDRVGRFASRAILTVIVLAVAGLVLAHVL